MSDEDDKQMIGSAAIARQLERIADSMERYETHIGVFLRDLVKDEDARIVIERFVRKWPLTAKLLEHISEEG